jgi:hypothetical protein
MIFQIVLFFKKEDPDGPITRSIDWQDHGSNRWLTEMLNGSAFPPLWASLSEFRGDPRSAPGERNMFLRSWIPDFGSVLIQVIGGSTSPASGFAGSSALRLTRCLALTRCCPRGLTFYVAHPIRSILPLQDTGFTLFRILATLEA